MTKRRQKRPAKPLDNSSLRELAFTYVARFATSKSRLRSYLLRKVRERGWEGEGHPDPEALAQDMADNGYIDDAGYAAMKAGSLLRRGYGARRVGQMYHIDGIGETDREEADGLCEDGRAAALITLARKKHMGPFATGPADPKTREKHFAVLIRAGHDFTLAKKLLDLGPEYRDEPLEELLLH